MDDEEYYQTQVSGSAWTGQSPQYKQRVFEAIDTLGDVAGKWVVDVGCGDGTSVSYLLTKTKYAYGLEFSKEKVAAAQEQKIPVHWFDMDHMKQSQNKTGEDSYVSFQPADVVFCSHSLEHTRDALQSTKNLCSFVKPGGRLVIIVPHEEEFPKDNPSHTQWMTNERIAAVKAIIASEFGIPVDSVFEERKHRLEDECWLTATRPIV